MGSAISRSGLRRGIAIVLACLLAGCGRGVGTVDDSGGRIALDAGWRLHSAARVAATGDVISQPGFDAGQWSAISVPNTVVGALVENGSFEDPFPGGKLRSLPGMEYSLSKRFALEPTPAASPYKPAWWYRMEFTPPPALAGRSVTLHFDGINYRANIWLNGKQIANATEVAGAFRQYEFDVGKLLLPGANALAVEVHGPEPHDLAFTWVDWNPTPPDKNMGLWAPVYLTHSGSVVLRHPFVSTDLEVPGLARAALTVMTEVWNTSDQPVEAVVDGAIETLRFSKTVKLAPREHARIRFTPAEFADLVIEHPRIWWPYRLGNQEFYTLTLEARVAGQSSDRSETRFGIQKISSTLTSEGSRLITVNGRPLLIRGGGWASDMFLREKSPGRLQAEFRYVKEMGLNTIRMEGKPETDAFYELADREGILLMPGWSCCNQWEQWDEWDDEDHRVAAASLRDQIQRIRNHPSVAMWLNGSDYAPPPAIEQTYLAILRDLNWDKPVISSASERTGKSTPSGIKMRGPYDYVPPKYWLTDSKYGGAFGFAGEISPGAAVPPIESLQRMFGPQHLWPIDEVWRLHAGTGEFQDIQRFTRALEARYGTAGSAEDYARKAQALTYEGERAMFEAYSRNRYRATGVIQWMLNNAWPSTIWHLYDYYLRPGGGYFGTRKALEPLHVQYSYDDRSVVLVNDLHEAAPAITVRAEVYDGALKKLHEQEVRVDAGPDAIVRAFTLPAFPEAGSRTRSPGTAAGIRFVRLRATDARGAELSRNFYWLSTHDDELDWAQSTWFYTPTSQDADLRALAQLPATTLSVTPEFGSGDGEGRATVRVTNTGTALAFQVRLKLVDGARNDEEVLPVYWEDNYFELFPGETRTVKVAYPETKEPHVSAEAWNGRTP